MTRAFSSLFGGKEKESDAPQTAPTSPKDFDKSRPYELIEQDGKLNYKLAPCCHPIPGDALGSSPTRDR